jgi:hypothetical protein
VKKPQLLYGGCSPEFNSFFALAWVKNVSKRYGFGGSIGRFYCYLLWR